MTNVSVRQDAWREILRQQGRSLTWLAQRTGVAVATVFAYSQGRRRPTDAWLARTAEILGVPLEQLTGEVAS